MCEVSRNRFISIAVTSNQEGTIIIEEFGTPGLHIIVMQLIHQYYAAGCGVHEHT